MNKPNPTHKRLEDLIARIDAATDAVRTGRRIDMKPLDAESLVITKIMKQTKRDETAKALLSKSVLAIERLTFALEDQVKTLKDKKK